MAVLRLNPTLAKTRVHAGAPAECQTGPAADCGNALGDWARANISRIEDARRRFDGVPEQRAEAAE